MRFWLWFWGFMVVWISISTMVFLYLDKGYSKNSYPMYVALIIASLMYQWTYHQHLKWKIRKEHKLKELSREEENNF
jgi:hypothetical protein